MTCTFIPSLLNSFDLPSYSSELRKRYTLRLLLMYLEALGKGFSCFLGETERWLEETIVSSKAPAVPVDLNMNFISKFNHSFTNCDCLHCAIKLYTILRKKEPTRQTGKRYEFFSFKMLKRRFSRFWKCLETT